MCHDALINRWQSVGFIHGVIHMVNIGILGLPIDYGPSWFLDPFPHTLTLVTTQFSSGKMYVFYLLSVHVVADFIKIMKTSCTFHIIPTHALHFATTILTAVYLGWSMAPLNEEVIIIGAVKVIGYILASYISFYNLAFLIDSITAIVTSPQAYVGFF